MNDRAAAVTDVLIAVVGGVVLLAGASRRTLATVVGAVGVLGPVFAAALGALRFSGVERAIPAHLVAVHLAAAVGMPMIGLSLALAVARPAYARRIAILVVVVLVALSIVLPTPTWRTIVGAAGMIASAIAASSLARRDRVAGIAGMSGAILVVIDGLVIGGPGDLLGVSRTAWFHVVFAIAIGALGFALLRADSRAS